jgi:uncharacterized protein with GYD domain
MSVYMHQWRYKDKHIRDMLDKSEESDRARVVRAAIEASDGKLIAFYFCFGEYDGVAISEFADESNALACAMLLLGQGRIQSLHTSTLFTPESSTKSIDRARDIVRSSPGLAGRR